MKIKITFVQVLMLMFISALTSCSTDKKPIPSNGYLYCAYCDGTGYDYYYLGGLISEECSSCYGSGYVKAPYGSTKGSPIYQYSPSFQGKAKRRGSCNITSHHCPYYVDDGNNNCSNCAEQNATCHATKHQEV